MSLPFQKTHTLELLHDRLARLYEEDNELDKRAQESIQSITIIFAFAGTFKLFETPTGQGPVDGLLLACIFFLYGAIVVLSFYMQRTYKWQEIVSTAPEHNDKYINASSDEAYYKLLVEDYGTALKMNADTVNDKIGLHRFISFLIIIKIVLIILMIAL